MKNQSLVFFFNKMVYTGKIYPNCQTGSPFTTSFKDKIFFTMNIPYFII